VNGGSSMYGWGAGGSRENFRKIVGRRITTKRCDVRRMVTCRSAQAGSANEQETSSPAIGAEAEAVVPA